MVTQTHTIERNGKPGKLDVAKTWNKAITKSSVFEDKDELLDIVYWGRQVVGMILGVIFGFIPLKGIIALALFSMLSCAVTYFYCVNFQGIDEEEYGGVWELLKEGFMTSFASFLVVWIIVYNGIHFDSIHDGHKMVTQTHTIERNGKPGKLDVAKTWNKAITKSSVFEDKDELLDIVYWGRQVVGMILGVIFGFIPLKGIIALALFSMLSCAVTYFYCVNFQGIDEEEYGGVWELLKEGFMTSFASFLVVWIIVYNGIHFDSIHDG
uniref:CSON002476 protein n=2 Tax=Culicoides sonorensis TaxID=179676 RepID=A0A336MLJ3_CULSO